MARCREISTGTCGIDGAVVELAGIGVDGFVTEIEAERSIACSAEKCQSSFCQHIRHVPFNPVQPPFLVELRIYGASLPR